MNRNLAVFALHIGAIGVVGAVIYLTGGLPSQFAHLYYLPVVTGAVMLPTRYGLAVALLAAVAVSPLPDLFHRPLGFDVYYSDPSPWNLRPSGWIVRPFVYVLVAVTATRLVASLNRTTDALRLTKASIDQAIEAAFWVDAEGRMLYVNASACQSLGYSRKKLLTKAVWDINPDIEAQSWNNLLEELKLRGSLRLKSHHVTKDGRLFPVELTMHHVRFQDVDCVFVFPRDITDRVKSEERIVYTAQHDALTQLPNRVLFEDRLQVAIANARRRGDTLAVLSLDLDRFKQVNDSLGYSAGDDLLTTVAREMRLLLPEGDTVARIGGDEFTILLQDVESPGFAAQFADKIREVIGIPRVISGQSIQVSASIGITFYPADGMSASSLLACADLAMHEAKSNGKDRWEMYAPRLKESSDGRLTLENDLRGAVDRGELVLHYQPIFDIDRDEVVGVEALMRWEHPIRGMIGPDEFIPVAEETGLIVPLGEWALRTACRQAAEWQREALPVLTVSVNFSGHQFHRSDVVGAIISALHKYKLDPRSLHIEITEAVALHDFARMSDLLTSLDEIGIQIVIDDFGTGYSSLKYLLRLPIHAIKIDRSFVSGLPDDTRSVAIVKATLALAQSLGVRVVAEGVETEEQLSFLRKHGCHGMQGFLRARPMPPDELGLFLLAQQKRAGLLQLAKTRST